MTVNIRAAAIAVIEDELEAALAASQRGALCVVELDPDGDGVLLARSATLERSDQLTGQLLLLLGAAEDHGRRPKLIVACAGVNGMRPIEERPDLVAVVEAITSDGCRWIGTVDRARITRSVLVMAQLVDILRERRVEVYIGSGEHS